MFVDIWLQSGVDDAPGLGAPGDLDYSRHCSPDVEILKCTLFTCFLLIVVLSQSVGDENSGCLPQLGMFLTFLKFTHFSY